MSLMSGRQQAYIYPDLDFCSGTLIDMQSHCTDDGSMRGGPSSCCFPFHTDGSGLLPG